MESKLNYSSMVDIYKSLKNKDPLDNINYIENNIKNYSFDQIKVSKIIVCCLAIKNRDTLEYLSLMSQDEQINLVSFLKD